MARINIAGKAAKGSQFQFQEHVNRRPDELGDEIKRELSIAKDWTFQWVSPLEREGYREYHDKSFFKILGLEEHLGALGNFWPSGGPRWDGLARLRRGDETGALLVEAKAHVDEIETGACGATANESISKIRLGLEAAAEHYGADTEYFQAWFSKRYQQANRLAHLLFLRRLGVQAWLANVYFVDDETHIPTSLSGWEEPLAASKRDLGLSGALEYTGDVFIESLPGSI